MHSELQLQLRGILHATSMLSQIMVIPTSSLAIYKHQWQSTKEDIPHKQKGAHKETQ